METTSEHLSNRSTWTRLIYMLLFIIAYTVVEVVLWCVVVVQFIFAALTGGPNKRLLHFGGQLSRYFYEIFSFLTYNTDDKPFPFQDWPAATMLIEKKIRAPRKKKAPSEASPEKKKADS